MGWFDNEDDKQKPQDPKELVRQYIAKKYGGETMGPPVSAAPSETQERIYEQRPTAEKFADMSADTSTVDKATKDATSEKRNVGIIEGLATMFAPRKIDTGFYDGLRKDADAKVTSAKEGQRQKLADFLTTDKLQQQGADRGYDEQDRARKGVEQGQKDTEFGWKKADNDPMSNASVAARPVIAKALKLDPKMLEGMSYAQMKELAAHAKKEGTTARDHWQLQPINENGKIVLYRINVDTGEKAPVDLQKGYANKFDAVAGTMLNASDSTAPAVPVMTADGKPLSEARTALTEARAHAAATGTENAKQEQQAEEAQVKVGKFQDLKKRWKGLYQTASKEGPLGGNTGPIKGRIAGMASSAGFDMGKATDTANSEIGREAANYLKEVTGLTATDAQYERLLGQFPTFVSDPGNFDARLDAWEHQIQEAAKERKALAGQKTGGQTTPPKYTPEQESSIKGYMEMYPTKTREQIIKKLGL